MQNFHEREVDGKGIFEYFWEEVFDGGGAVFVNGPKTKQVFDWVDDIPERTLRCGGGRVLLLEVIELQVVEVYHYLDILEHIFDESALPELEVVHKHAQIQFLEELAVGVVGPDLQGQQDQLYNCLAIVAVHALRMIHSLPSSGTGSYCPSTPTTLLCSAAKAYP